MTVAFWEAGKFYAPGDVVKPTAAPPPVATPVGNGTFESGDTGWTKGAGWGINNGDEPYQGTWSARFDGVSAGSNLDSASAPVTAGTSVTLSAVIQQGASSAGQAGARAILVWLTGADVEISTSEGNMVDNGSSGAWKTSTVTAIAPPTAEKVRARVRGFRLSGSSPLYADNVQWNLVSPAPPTGLIYRAVQALLAKSAATEPLWPLTNGLTVVDGDVTWEAVDGTRIVWIASPILESGATEPTWPIEVDASIIDNTIAWKASPLRVTDPNCPNTKVAAMGASKVFAGNGDITSFCATNNPLDWTTPEDAGYLPTGFQQYGANDVAVLNIYRGSLVVMNSEVFQLWQIDPDPNLMSIIDQMPAIGSVEQKAAMSVANDLLYLPSLGVRSVGIAGASTNLKAGDVGMPIDALVQAALATARAAGVEPLAMYYPGAGQFWLSFATPAVEGWVPISESGLFFSFESSGQYYNYVSESFDSVPPQLSGSTVTFLPPPPPEGMQAGSSPRPSFSITINTESPSVIPVRVTRNYFSSGVNQSVFGEYFSNGNIEFSWYSSESLVTQGNEAPLVAFETFDGWEPASFTADVDSNSEFRIDALGEGGSVESFSFTFEVYVQAQQASSQVFVYDMGGGGAGKWSRYIFPFAIDAFTLLGDKMLLRSGDFVVEVSEDALVDQVYVDGKPGYWEDIPFEGLIRWPYLDMGAPGQDKQLLGIDITGTGESEFSIGYDQKNFAAMTDPLLIPADSLYEGMIPYEVVAPTFSVQLTYAGSQKWKLDSLILEMER